MTRHRWGSCAAAIVLAVLLAACSGDDNNDNSNNGPPSTSTSTTMGVIAPHCLELREILDTFGFESVSLSATDDVQCEYSGLTPSAVFRARVILTVPRTDKVWVDKFWQTELQKFSSCEATPCGSTNAAGGLQTNFRTFEPGQTIVVTHLHDYGPSRISEGWEIYVYTRTEDTLCPAYIGTPNKGDVQNLTNGAIAQTRKACGV